MENASVVLAQPVPPPPPPVASEPSQRSALPVIAAQVDVEAQMGAEPCQPLSSRTIAEEIRPECTGSLECRYGRCTCPIHQNGVCICCRKIDAGCRAQSVKSFAG